MTKTSQKQGRVILPAGATPWEHEKKAANTLALAGYHVEFIPEANIKTPDIYLERTQYKIKSPVSSSIKAVGRNLTKALKKCPNIIFDSSRMKVRDDQILHELIRQRRLGGGLKKILFINKRGQIIDIEKQI